MSVQNFTREQKKAHKEIMKLEKELNQEFTLETFVLNPKIVKIQNRIEEIQCNCEHNWIDGKCQICHLEVKE